MRLLVKLMLAGAFAAAGVAAQARDTGPATREDGASPISTVLGYWSCWEDEGEEFCYPMEEGYEPVISTFGPNGG